MAHRGPDGKPRFFSGIAQDMSMIKTAESQLRTSEERLRALLEQGSDVILVVSADGAITYASPAIVRGLGYPAEDVVGLTAFDLIHPDDLVELLDRFARAIDDNREARGGLQCRARHADGSWRWVELFAANHLTTPGVGGVIINARDITARHSATEELASAAALLSSVMRAAASEAIFVTDTDARIVAFSRGAECLLGYQADDVIGRRRRGGGASRSPGPACHRSGCATSDTRRRRCCCARKCR